MVKWINPWSYFEMSNGGSGEHGYSGRQTFGVGGGVANICHGNLSHEGLPPAENASDRVESHRIL